MTNDEITTLKKRIEELELQLKLHKGQDITDLNELLTTMENKYMKEIANLTSWVETLSIKASEDRDTIDELKAELGKKQDLFPLHKGRTDVPLMNYIIKLENKVDDLKVHQENQRMANDIFINKINLLGDVLRKLLTILSYTIDTASKVEIRGLLSKLSVQEPFDEKPNLCDTCAFGVHKYGAGCLPKYAHEHEECVNGSEYKAKEPKPIPDELMKRIKSIKSEPMKKPEPYDIEDNMVCWRCKHASIEGGRIYYGIKAPEMPKRPGCKMWSKLTEVDAWDIPDPMAPINEEGCKFEDLGYDIREREPKIEQMEREGK
jgi:uncharacterized coiled-coil protein SlyX